MQYVLVALIGGGYSSLFIAVTALITEMTPRHKLSRNFSLLSAFYGCSYIIYGVATAFTNYPTSDKPYFQQFCIAIFLTGTIIFITYAGYFRLFLNESIPDDTSNSSIFLLGDKKLSVNFPTRSKLCLLLLSFFYSFIIITLYTMYTQCCYITLLTYGSEALICYGSCYMLFSIYSSYHQRHWRTGANTVLSSVMFLFGYIIMSFMFTDSCPIADMIDDEPIPPQWMLIPLAGMFLGSGTGLLNSEIFTLVSEVWNTKYRFSYVVLMECFWGILATFFLYEIKLTYYLCFATGCTVVYLVASLVIYHDLRCFMSRVNGYQTTGFGSVYSS